MVHIQSNYLASTTFKKTSGKKYVSKKSAFYYFVFFFVFNLDKVKRIFETEQKLKLIKFYEMKKRSRK